MKIATMYARFKTMYGGPVHVLLLNREVLEMGHELTLISRHISDKCMPYVAKGTKIVSPRWMHFRTGIQLIDSFVDVMCACILGFFYVPKDADALVVYSDAALPAIFFNKVLRRSKVPCTYYCFQPTQFAYNLTWQKAKAYPPLGYLLPLVAPIYRLFDKLSAKAADTIITTSTVSMQRCRDLYNAKKLFLVPPGVDLEFLDSADGDRIRKKHGLVADAPILVTVNKLVQHKNIEYLIRAMKIVVEKFPKAVAFGVGEGPDKERLEGIIKELGLEENFILTGFLKEWSEVCDYYKACDVHVFLEKDVPFGMTPLEAGMFYKPTIAVGSGGTLDTIDDGVTGYHLDPELNVEEVASRIIELLEDRQKAEKMGQAARKKAENFTWPNCGIGLMEVINKMVEERSLA